MSLASQGEVGSSASKMVMGASRLAVLGFQKQR